MRKTGLLLFLIGIIVLPQTLFAQTRGGAHLGHNLDAEEIAVGVQAELDFIKRATGLSLIFNPVVQALLVDGATSLQFDVNALFQLGEGTIVPKVGGGLALLYVDSNSHSNTELGLNAVGQVDLNMGGNWAPFAAVRLTFQDGTSTTLMGGVNVNL